ncbi:MAG TPA: methylmalonyl-CoA epimerase [Bacteroidota bacterium]|nr:methylmalonyl-CoA epimerase [Candidatus Kapabacteria bacterium]HRS01861.1 methylmalonyl-CoA epimerase [Bacteroidota bacterium]HRT67319.1 methylmalonyl-CoA epimerase [Bacteroidota bacterium]
MIKSINHIGIAVKNLDESLEIFKKLFQFENIHQETVEDQKVKIASFEVGNVRIELTQATDEDSPIAKFIAKNGEGIQHIAFETDDINQELSRLKSENFRLIDEAPRKGAHNMQIAFVHPKSTNSVLTEICQQK